MGFAFQRHETLELPPPMLNRLGFAGGSMCGCPVSCKCHLRLRACDRVRSCVRPVMRLRGAAGRHGDTRIRRKSTRRASRSWSLGAFPDPDQTDHLPLTFTTSSHAAPHGLAVAEHMLRLLHCQDPGSPPSWSTSPIPSEPSCWPTPWRPTSAVCDPAFGRATSLVARRVERPTG